MAGGRQPLAGLKRLYLEDRKTGFKYLTINGYGSQSRKIEEIDKIVGKQQRRIEELTQQLNTFEVLLIKAELGGVKPRTLPILLIVTYGMLTVIPTVFLAILISQEYTLSKILVLVFPLLILACSVATKRKREFMKN